MLKTEMRNPNTHHISSMSSLEMVDIMCMENYNVNKAIDAAKDDIAAACDMVAEIIQNGGKVYYIGAGTSGRLGVCDATECPPTFGVPADMFVGIMAGGLECLVKASENEEDNDKAGIRDLDNHGFTGKDVLIGISASGTAEYVISAINYARSLGAKTITLTNNLDTKLGKTGDVNIAADTGPEVITGSTRMKAGTAQKIILNMISTAAMVKCGYVYENLMVNLTPKNKKLTKRMINIVSDILECSLEEAEKLLNENEWNIKKAIKGAK